MLREMYPNVAMGGLVEHFASLGDVAETGMLCARSWSGAVVVGTHRSLAQSRMHRTR